MHHAESAEYPCLAPEGPKKALNPVHLIRPERWDEDLPEYTKTWGYLPFSGGPRICLGRK